MAFLFENTPLSWAILWVQPLLLLAYGLFILGLLGQQMDALVRPAQLIVKFIDGLSTSLIEICKWLAVTMALGVAALVITRYVFGVSSIKAQESIIYMYALLFLLAAPATLLTDGHVRVDIFYEKLSARGRAIVDILGTTFLLMPVAILIFKYGGAFAARAWVFKEGSAETDGLPFVYLLKTAIPVFAALMMLQGSAMALRAALFLYGAPLPSPETIDEPV